MPQSKKSPKPAKTVTLYDAPLTRSTFGQQSEIDAQIENGDKWKTIATVYSTNTTDAEDLADQIIEALTSRRQEKDLFHETETFLKTILKEKTTPEKTAHAAKDLLVRIQAALVD